MQAGEYDIIVVGGGGSGLAAGVAASQNGARVLLLEKTPELGGTTGIAVGSFTANRTVYQRRKGIEDNPDARTEAYERMSNQGDAILSQTVKFDSGSTDIAAADGGELNRLISGDKNSRFLVVGYSSVDGDPQSNAKLSSRRASAGAQRIVGNSGETNRIEAVYFGQTSRFSKAYRAPNRVVEVWRIK